MPICVTDRHWRLELKDALPTADVGVMTQVAVADQTYARLLAEGEALLHEQQAILANPTADPEDICSIRQRLGAHMAALAAYMAAHPSPSC